MELYNKDSQIFGVLKSLIEAAADKDEQVKSGIATCIRDLAKPYPDEVLQTICTYKKNHPKISTAHTACLLHIAESVCRVTDSSAIDEESSVGPLVSLAISEMTSSQELITDWQLPASQLLVALSRNYCDQVMEGLLAKFQPGVVPHYFVLHTLGSVAAANSYSMVPYIKACLGTMLPMMGGLRSDAVKQAYAYTLGRFADAIQDYLANLDQAPDPSVTKDVFSTEMNLAMGVLINTWLSSSKEQQMMENVLHAIAAMFPLLPPGKCAELAPKLLQALLSLKRRSGSTPTLPLCATRCLAAILAQLSTEASGSAAMEPCLDHLMTALSDLVFEAPDLEQPLTIKNHYEALRCFDTLASRFPERLSTHLSLQLRVNNEKERARALVVLAHLVNCGHAERHLPDLATSVRALINDPSTKVRRAVVKVVVVLAHKGHLKNTDGADFLLFVIRNCINRPVNVKADTSVLIEQDELRQVCCDSLVLLSSAAPQVANLLKPLLLQCLVLTDFAPIAGLIAKCLNSINSRSIPEELECQDVQQELKIPSSFDVLARCIVLLGSPLPDTGTHILQFLQTSKAIDLPQGLLPVLTKMTSQMIIQLQDPKWELAQWGESLLGLVRELVEGADNPDWITSLSQALVRQGQQTLDPHERHAQLTSLACLASSSADSKLAATVVQDALDAARLFQHCEQVCADTIAECACGGGEDTEIRHLHLVLSQLRLTTKDLPAASHQSSSAASKLIPAFLANIGSADRSRRGELAAGSERLRCAILLSYGELCKRAPGVELLPKLESSGVMEWMLQQLQTTKDDVVRVAALKAMGQVAAAFHPNCNSGLIVLECRQKALTLTMGQMALGKKDVTALALCVATSLIELPPSLDADSRLLILKAGFDKVFEHLTDEVSGGDLIRSLEKLCNATMLCAGVTPASMDELLTLLEPWLRSSLLTQRTTATILLSSALTCYAAHLQFGFENPSSFCVASSVLSRAVPRCTDLSPACRSAGVKCVRLALVIAASYEGRQPTDVEAELEKVFATESLLSSINSDDPNTLYEATTQLAKVICVHLPPSQLPSLLNGLVTSLTDPEAVSSAGTSVVLNAVIREKGAEFFHHTADVLSLIIRHLPEILSESTKTGVVHCVASLARHHPKPVTLALMHQPLPYNVSVQSCWHVIAKENDLAGEVCGALLSIISTNTLCEEPRDKASPRVALSEPLAAVSALHEMFISGAEPMTEFATSMFPEILSALLLALAGLVGACPPVNMPSARHRTARSAATAISFVPNRDAYNLVPGRVALETCRSFLMCTGCNKAADTLAQCTHVETGENITSFIEMIPNLVRNIVESRPQNVHRLVECLNKNSSSNIESARITVIAVIAELVQWPRADSILLDGLLQQLTDCLDDTSTVVRQLALQGLSFVAKLDIHQRDRYVSSVLVALLQGLEDSPGEGIGLGLAQEALAGLAVVLPLVNPKQANDLQASLALRIRPFFTKDNAMVRAAAFQTLGELAQCGDSNDPKPAFVEQLTSSLVNLLLGLCDTQPSVVQACKKTLRHIAPLLTADKTAAMLKEHLIDNGCLQFPQFAANLVKIMAEELPDQFPYFVMTAMGFTRSQWPDTRANAALLIGFLCGYLPASQKQHVSVDSVCTRLTQLLTDPSTLVRANAARAISCVFLP